MNRILSNYDGCRGEICLQLYTFNECMSFIKMVKVIRILLEECRSQMSIHSYECILHEMRHSKNLKSWVLLDCRTTSRDG